MPKLPQVASGSALLPNSLVKTRAQALQPLLVNARKTYQKYLRDAYDRRRARNLSYSLRAYARDLGVASSKLSQYLNGDCGISGQRARVLAAKLQLSEAETELFVCSAEAAHSRDPSARAKAAVRLKELLKDTFSKVNMDKFELIRDWYHIAILELTELSSFQPDVTWIANAIGISRDEALAAVKRLEELGLLKVGKSHWEQTEKDFETPPEISSRAIREYHKQMLGLVEKRFEGVPVEKRELGSVVFAVDENLVPELKKLVRQFQRDVATVIEKSSKKNTLYALNTQLLPILQQD